MSGGTGDVLEMPCLGRPFQLGMLYDCRSDRLIPGVTLWGAETLKNAVSIEPRETSGYEIIAEDSFNEKTTRLEVGAGLKLSLLGEMVHVSGAANFVYDRISSKKQARVSLRYKYTSRLEQLTMDHLDEFEYPAVFDEDIATHVVTGVLYGADAFFVFDREVGKDEDFDEVHVSMEAMVRALPGLQVGGGASPDTQFGEKSEEKLKCSFHGDFNLMPNPTTFHDVAKVYQKLPELLREDNSKPVPKKVWLYSLGKFNNKAQRIVHGISSGLIDDMQMLMENLHELVMQTNDLIKSEVCSQFVGIKEKLQKGKELIASYQARLEKSLATILPEIRGGGAEEAKLTEILKENSLSPFSRQHLSSWISGKEKGTKLLSGYLQQLQQQHIQLAFAPGEMDVIVQDLENEKVLCFDFNITRREDAHLQKMETDLCRKKVSQEDSSPKPWYETPALMQEMQLRLRLYLHHVKANCGRQDVKYVVTDGYSEPAAESSQVAIISLYENACATEFELPDQLGKPTASDVTHDSLKLNWTKPKHGAKSVQSYTLFCQPQDGPWFFQAIPSTRDNIHMFGLDPETVYVFKLTAETAAGVSPESELSDPIKTKSIHQPGKPTASEVTHNSLKLNWTKPKYGVESVQSYTVFYRSASDPPDKWCTVTTSSAQEYVKLSKLAPRTVYQFKVRAETAGGASPESELSDPIETKPIHQPGKPTASHVTHNNLKLNWTKPKYDFESVQSYTISYHSLSDPPDKWCTLKTPGTQEYAQVSKLAPKTVYHFKVRAETAAGGSPESEPSDAIETKPIYQPGKPTASDVTHNSLKLNWTKPEHAAESIQTYTLFYRPLNGPNNKWFSQAVSSTRDIHVTGLDPETVYVFKLAAKTSAGTSPESELSDPITTKPSPAVPLASKMLTGCKLISKKGIPRIYQLPVEVVMDKKDVAKVHVGHSYHRRSAVRVPHKVLMVLGATGAGKSTLINGIVNYIMGVHWEDEFRFKLITDEGGLSQAHSQTRCITAYTFHHMEGSPLPYSLTVIDTPGFGDTGGLERDKEITALIKKFFSISGKEGIDQLNGIGFVTQASLARLTQTQRYIIDSILSIFGKDIGGNIFLMTTFADGQRPPVLDAVKAAAVPIQSYFKFNNSALFPAKSAESDDNFDEMFWKMGMKSFDTFFDKFAKADSRSLQLTKEVLKEREQLETIIQGLQPQIRAGLARIDEIRQEEQILKRHQAEILVSKEFTYSVTVTKQRKVDLPTGTYTTNCLKCNYTCHQRCAISDDDYKYQCASMSGSSWNATCNVCPGKCSWREHKNNRYWFEIYQDKETRTSEDLKARYESAMTDKNQVEGVIKQINAGLEELGKAVLLRIQQAKKSLQRLDEIALKPNPLTEVQYIDLLIQSEEHQANPGWMERVKALKTVREQAEILSKLKNPQASGKTTKSKTGKKWFWVSWWS